jgi:Ser/Thr protein kinase RdoA (MazF antagonist)
MHKPLSDNPDHVRELCERLHIGGPSADLPRVLGGLHHRMWRLETHLGSYAVKQLSPDTTLEEPATRDHYNASEAIAEAFGRRGIPTVFALNRDGEYLQILNDVGYLVHPWRNAAVLPLSKVSQRHALEVAGILARMHAQALEYPGLKEHEFDIPLEDNIRLLVDFAQDFHIELAVTLRRALPSFLEIANTQAQATLVLEQQLVISHGDLDQKNVLWDAQDNPGLIDWESARRLNPTYEALLQALNWSGIAARFSPDLFGSFMAAYEDAGGSIDPTSITAAYQCVLADWVNWLMYNVGRCLDVEDAEQRSIGQQQVAFVLATLQHIMDRVPGLLDIPDPLTTGVA